MSISTTSRAAERTAPAAEVPRRSRTRRTLSALVALGASLVLLTTGPASAAPKVKTYDNPVSKSFADTFADPSIIHAVDGWWYAYSTADPLKAGDEPGIMHIARTRDFVSWQYEGTVFNAGNRPSWATSTSGLWAPDIRYVNGRYVLYYTVTDTTLNAGDDSAIGAATSASPVGPWTPIDHPVVAPRHAPTPDGGFLWTFDPAAFTDVNGHRYLYYGSYFGGLWASRLSADGLTTVGAPTQVAIDNRYEGSYVVRHGSWYYLMGSSANCCAGPVTGYSVFTGRSKSPLGPFVDADGISLLASRVGGTLLLTQNGNRWIGAGHHALTTDDAGRDFVVYHALDRNQPWLTTPLGITRRPMLLDRVDWIGGWPRVRAGAGPSDTPQPAPVTGSSAGINQTNPAAAGFRHLTAVKDAQSGAAARVRGSATSTSVVPGNPLRVRLTVKGDNPLTVRLGRASSRVTVTVDPQRGRLVASTRRAGATRTSTDTLPAGGSSWRTLTVEVRGSTVLAQLSQSDLNDPLAEVRLSRSGLALASAPVRLSSRSVLVDNVSVRTLARDAQHLVAVPRAGRLLIDEPFNTQPSGSAWTWVRPDADATVSGGQLNWPVENADLNGLGGTGGLLLHSTPAGNWIAQTKVHLDLGTTDVRNYQQAGLVAWQNDDDFARLSTVAIWNTRQTEFNRELPLGNDTIHGGALIGTPAPTVWLRLAHTRNAAGEHLYRAGTSRDGVHWTWGATWTFAASATPKIGLVAQGGANPPVVASFSYLRFYALR